MQTIPIVDTHLHLWDPALLRYPWLETVPTLNRPHRIADYRAATDGLPIERMVFVQCEADFTQYADEVRWVTEQAESDPRIEAIVAWAPLEDGDRARPALEALRTNPRLRGIRRIIQFEENPDFCLQPDFVRGVRLLEAFDLHFEICIKGDAQFANALELVRRCPGVRFVLDHIGKPFIQEQRMEPWGRCIGELAQLPNTWCKVSGMVNEADWSQWTPRDLHPYFQRVVDAFGFDRLLFGGDWPVCTLASSYQRWVETLREVVGRVSEAEQRKLFHDNAMDVYRLKSREPAGEGT